MCLLCRGLHSALCFDQASRFFLTDFFSLLWFLNIHNQIILCHSNITQHKARGIQRFKTCILFEDNARLVVCDIKEGGHFSEMPEVSEVPDLINLHNSWNFRHVPEVLERMPEGMPKMLEWILEARSEAGSAGSNYFWVLPALPTLPALSSRCPPSWWLGCVRCSSNREI